MYGLTVGSCEHRVSLLCALGLWEDIVRGTPSSLSYTIISALPISALLSRDGGFSKRLCSPKKQSESQLWRKLSDRDWRAAGSFSASVCLYDSLYDLGKCPTRISHLPGVLGSSQAGKKMKGVDAAKHLSQCPIDVIRGARPSLDTVFCVLVFSQHFSVRFKPLAPLRVMVTGRERHVSWSGCCLAQSLDPWSLLPLSKLPIDSGKEAEE